MKVQLFIKGFNSLMFGEFFRILLLQFYSFILTCLSQIFFSSRGLFCKVKYNRRRTSKYNPLKYIRVMYIPVKYNLVKYIEVQPVMYNR